MDSTFIRKSFYIQPPSKDASAEEWAKWIKKDNRRAAAHKAQVTKSLAHADTPEEYAAGTTRKVNGVWKQVPNVGFSGGNGEDEPGEAQPVEEATQERTAIVVRMEEYRHKRGGSRKGKSARRHRNKKRRK